MSRTEACMDPGKALALLPHRAPFRFVDEVWVDGEHLRGRWRIRGDEEFFRGHFPGHPLVPGVLLTESLAQLSGVAAATFYGAEGGTGMLATAHVRFRAPVAPPAVVELSTRITRRIDRLLQFDTEARVDGARVADGLLTLFLTTAGRPA